MRAEGTPSTQRTRARTSTSSERNSTRASLPPDRASLTPNPLAGDHDSRLAVLPLHDTVRLPPSVWNDLVRTAGSGAGEEDVGLGLDDVREGLDFVRVARGRFVSCRFGSSVLSSEPLRPEPLSSEPLSSLVARVRGDDVLWDRDRRGLGAFARSSLVREAFGLLREPLPELSSERSSDVLLGLLLESSPEPLPEPASAARRSPPLFAAGARREPV